MSITKNGAYVVTTDDGRFFRCHVEAVGREAERRWIFIDADEVAYVGPPWFPLAHEAELQQLVAVWWETKKALGQEGVNAERMRDRLSEG